MPLDSITDNPYYERRSINSDFNDECHQMSPELESAKQMEYPIIASCLLSPIKDIGEGAFSKVHLASFCPDSTAAATLVAVNNSFTFMKFIINFSCVHY